MKTWASVFLVSWCNFQKSTNNSETDAFRVKLTNIWGSKGVYKHGRFSLSLANPLILGLFCAFCENWPLYLIVEQNVQEIGHRGPYF